ncbi:MAG TPA: RNA-binding protein [Chthoniobacterales bacterium]|jgi:RNA recognition motif-containing protein|nr:RNA-binding protein [Chthoniobacterales bacterium]
MSAKLYVGNLSFATTELDLQDLFGQVGTVVDVKIIQDKFTGKSRGFGFVTMESNEQASEAIGKFNGYSLDNRQLTVNEARPPEPRQDRFYTSEPSSRGGGKDNRRGRDRDFRRR